MQNSFPLSRDLNPWPLIWKKRSCAERVRNPGIVAIGLQGLKRSLFCWYQPSSSLSEACTSNRVAIQLLNLQPHATGAGWWQLSETEISINQLVSCCLWKKQVEIVCPNQSNYNSLAQSRQQPFRECLPVMTSDLEKLLLHKNPFCCFNWAL